MWLQKNHAKNVVFLFNKYYEFTYITKTPRNRE